MVEGRQCKCDICHCNKSTLALKKLSNYHWICSKGKCRRLYDNYVDMIKEYGVDMVISTCEKEYSLMYNKDNILIINIE